MAPAEVRVIAAMPLLGAGKTDYVEVNRLVRETDKVPASA